MRIRPFGDLDDYLVPARPDTTRKPPRPARRRLLPGLRLTLGFTLVYLSLIVLIPLAALALKAASLTPERFWAIVTHERVLAAYRLTFGAAAAAATVNLVCGSLLAWVLVRYRFPGRAVADALVDLPFALPTAVAGIALTALYAPNGWLGAPLSAAGLQIAFAPAGIVIALVFVGLPFVVRTVQPILEQLQREYEEASATLGAPWWQTVGRVLVPPLVPAALTGFALALARGIGEYGSVIFIAGNKPYRTEIAPLLVVTRLEEFDYAGATAIAVVLLAMSFSLLLAIDFLQRWQARRAGLPESAPRAAARAR